jgi:hypothetical protein
MTNEQSTQEQSSTPENTDEMNYPGGYGLPPVEPPQGTQCIFRVFSSELFEKEDPPGSEGADDGAYQAEVGVQISGPWAARMGVEGVIRTVMTSLTNSLVQAGVSPEYVGGQVMQYLLERAQDEAGDDEQGCGNPSCPGCKPTPPSELN